MTDTSQAMSPMPQYVCHKKVWALKIEKVVYMETGTDQIDPRVMVHFEGGRFCPREFVLRGLPTPEAGWYMVQYEDGYISFSPGKVFEEGYSPLSSFRSNGFGWAIKQMQNGAKVCRSGWNGKGMFLLLIPGSTFVVSGGRPMASHFPAGSEVQYHAHIDMKTAQGDVVPWVASQADMLAVDWEVV